MPLDPTDAQLPNQPASLEYRPGAATVLLWSAWFGLVGGGLELAAFLAKCLWLDPRNFNVSRHFVWMMPVAGLVVTGGVGLVLAALAWVRPVRAPAALVAGVLAFVAVLGVVFRAPLATAACLLLSAGLATQVGRFLGARAGRFHAVVLRSLPVLCLALAATVGATCGRGAWQSWCARAGRRQPSPGGKNLLLVVLDTVRADRLSTFGYPRATSPNLTRLAARGVRFDRALATAPWTAPSHASLFTGHWADELSVGWGRPLDGTFPTLAEVLAARGYDTAGFVANTTYCSYETGLDRGFARYDDYDVSPRAVLYCSAIVQRVLVFLHKHAALARWFEGDGSSSAFRKTAARVNSDFLGWLETRGAGARARPFFAFLNYYDAHHPYLPPAAWKGGPAGLRPVTRADYQLLRNWWGLDKRRLGSRERELASDAYDHCIAYLDDQLGRLLETLEGRGVLRNTVVIVTADHGEHLGERQLYGHGVSLYRPELHVPLIVVDPDRTPSGRVVSEPVSLRDVAATVVDRLGIASSPLPGRSLARLWERNSTPEPGSDWLRSDVASAPEDDPNRGSSPARRGPLTSMVARGLHYIRDGEGREELYDMATDPNELADLAAARSDALPAFRAALRR